MGVATGTFTYPNGSPVANGVYQWKLSSDAIENGTTCVCPPLFSGYLDVSGNMTATFLFNDVLGTAYGTDTTYQLTIKDNGGRQVWNENYYLTGTAANINQVLPGSSTSGPVLYPFIRVAEVAYVIDGFGTTVAAGVKGQVNIPTLCIITGWVLTADQSGSAVIGVNACPFSSFPSGMASICGTDTPLLTTQQSNENLSVSVWTPTLAATTQLQFSVTSATTVTRLNLGIIVNIPYGY
jgi:hypothetical protein